MKTSNSGRTSILGKTKKILFKFWLMFGGTKYCDYTITPSNRSFFEFTDKEKIEVLSNAAQQSNEDQANLMAKSRCSCNSDETTGLTTLSGNFTCPVHKEYWKEWKP